MIRYTLKRLLRSYITLFAVISAVFLLLRLMPEEGYFANYDKMTPEQIIAAKRALGLDRPVPVQLFVFFSRLTHLDFGVSAKYRVGYPISSILSGKMPVSLAFGGGSILLGLIFAFPLCMVMAESEGTRLKIASRAGNAFIAFFHAVPSSVYHLFIQIYGFSLLNRFTRIPMLFSSEDPKSWILPLTSTAIANTAGFCLWLRRYMRDERNKDYVFLARASGLSRRRVSANVLRNAAVPFIHFIPNAFLTSMTGSVYIESRYSIPGMGGLLVEAVKKQDNPLVLALVVTYTALGVAGMFLGDMLLAAADPRIRLSGRK